MAILKRGRKKRVLRTWICPSDLESRRMLGDIVTIPHFRITHRAKIPSIEDHLEYITQARRRT
jgi:hypothetical protein